MICMTSSLSRPSDDLYQSNQHVLHQKMALFLHKVGYLHVTVTYMVYDTCRDNGHIGEVVLFQKMYIQAYIYIY